MIPKHALLDVEIAYARFNAQKTIDFGTESAFCLKRIGSLIATSDPARLGQSYYQQVLGLADEALEFLDEALAVFAALATSTRIDVPRKDETPRVTAALLERGFERTSSFVYLCGRPRAHPVGDLSIERWGPGRADDFMDLLAESGGTIDAERRALRRHHLCTDQFRVFTALFGGRPRSWATIFVHGCVGFLGNAYTLPDVRMQGAQLELFFRRIDDAASLGLEWVVTDVEPGTSSERNARRAGLSVSSEGTTWERG